MVCTFLNCILASFMAFADPATSGADHPKGDLPRQPGWPQGVHEIVNQPYRVHGFWVNSYDKLFYQSKQEDLHQMLNRFGKLEGVTVEVIIRANNGQAISPWSEQAAADADWAVSLAGEQPVTNNQNRITFEIWLGGQIDLNELQIPDTFDVRSGGEIDAFIEAHREKRNQ